MNKEFKSIQWILSIANLTKEWSYLSLVYSEKHYQYTFNFKMRIFMTKEYAITKPYVRFNVEGSSSVWILLITISMTIKKEKYN